MTGPFVCVQEARMFGPTWINVARIVKIQQSSNMTTISLAGAGMIQTEEPAEALFNRIAARRANGGRPSKASLNRACPG